MDDMWSNATDTKKSKKGKKGVVEEPAVIIVPEVEPAATEDLSDMWGTGKKDKKGKKGAKVEEPIVDVPEPPPEPPKDDLWSFGSTSKSKKDTKKDAKKTTTSSFGAMDDLLLDDDAGIGNAVTEEPAWPAWGTDAKADKKKSKKGAAADPVPPPPPEPVKEEDDWMSTSIWGG